MPNLENCSLAELETAIGAAATGRSRDRMRAIRALAHGYDLATVAGIFDVHERTVKEWINRFNRRGIDGLIDAPRSGAPPKIKPEESADLLELLEHPEEADTTHWTGKKFHGFLCNELGFEIGYSTLMAWLHDRDYRLKVPQPWPDRQDEAERQAFVERLQAWIADERVELWFTDETGIEGDPRPRRRFALKGTNPRVTKNGDHIRMNVCGMVCPRTGQFFALELSHSDAECFQVFLDLANAQVKLERPRQLLIMDNASWHKSPSLSFGRFEPVYLPAYSPDLNPIERLWKLLKAEWFSDFVAKSHEALLARIDQALLWVIGRGDANTLTCRIKTEL
jgi:transposase